VAASARIKNSPLPESAAPEEVQNYEADKDGGPNKDRILIAWYQPLSSASPWNWDAITILADKAQQSLKASKNKYDASWIAMPELMKQIAACLQETKKIMSPSSASSHTKMTAYQRRRSRKVMVCTLSHELGKYLIS
jgi:hypothetical protein